MAFNSPLNLMKPAAIFCIAYSRLQADQMVQRLKSDAFPLHDISILAGTGPVMAALGNIVSGLHSLGVPWVKARLYDGRLKEGRILIAVQATGADAIDLAKEILIKAGANDLCSTLGLGEQQRPQSESQPVRDAETQMSFA
jgi:hypothetical protein